jgi:hypothetical protein
MGGITSGAAARCRRLSFGDDITLRTTSQGEVFFDRANVQRVELVIGNPQARQASIAKGIGYGATFAAIWTVLGLLGGFQGFDDHVPIIEVYSATLGGGAAIGALKSKGKGPKYLRV